ncbi:MAG: YfiR family protein [Caulobacteraceae bacterium]
MRTAAARWRSLAARPSNRSQQPFAPSRANRFLTVTDGDVAGGGKSMVRFVVLEGRVRFMIDAGHAGQCGLTISSKLLALAADVRR